MRFRIPYATVALAAVLALVYVIERHPDTGVQTGQYFLSAVSVGSLPQLWSEYLLLAVGGTVAEQFVSRASLIGFTVLLAAGTIWLVESTHPNTVVVGLSGGSMGLIGFSTLAVAWYVVDRPESHAAFLAFSAFLLVASFYVSRSAYGYLVHTPILPASTPVRFYHPHTAYLAHVAGLSAGGLWWIVTHYLGYAHPRTYPSRATA